MKFLIKKGAVGVQKKNMTKWSYDELVSLASPEVKGYLKYVKTIKSMEPLMFTRLLPVTLMREVATTLTGEEYTKNGSFTLSRAMPT